MAKLTKAALKSIVKECLFEILLDASDSGDVMQENRTTQLVERSRKMTKKSRPKKLHPALDNMSYDKAPPKEPKINTEGLTSDPVMSAIFKDTAETTLREQAAAERGAPIAGGDAAALAASNNNPTDLFGESAKNWAALAFSDSSPKK